ncbi:TetR/AcrR family transcriptional regulator [Streptomyces cacaoi]
MDNEVTIESRVLDAADALFYAHGIQSVGMDRIRDVSGVPLKQIYRCFPSKGALIEAYLRRRDEWARTELEKRVAAQVGSTERVLAVFDWLYDWFDDPGFRGCAFLNAYGELGAKSPGVARVVREHKAVVRGYLGRLADETGASGADRLADQLAVLVDGAMSAAAVTGTPAPARQARAAAETLIGAATP